MAFVRVTLQPQLHSNSSLSLPRAERKLVSVFVIDLLSLLSAFDLLRPDIPLDIYFMKGITLQMDFFFQSRTFYSRNFKLEGIITYL